MPQFSQPFCRFRPYRASGWLSTSLASSICTIAVINGDLVLSGLDGTTIDRADVGSIELDTPSYAKRIGEVSFVRINGHQWAIDFSMCDFSARRHGWGNMR